jgi:hypothetical protein
MRRPSKSALPGPFDPYKKLTPIPDRGYTTADVAAASDLPVPTVKFLVTQGVIVPSIQRAAGRGHPMVFSFSDIVTARALRAMHFESYAAPPFRHIAEFLRGAEGRAFMKTLRGGSERPRILCVTAKGVVVDRPPEEVMATEEGGVVYCLDANRLAGTVIARVVERIILGVSPEPGPTGRAPMAKKGPRAPGPPKGRRARGPERPRSNRLGERD